MDDIKFHNEDSDHCWYSEDFLWGVIERYTDSTLLLYKSGVYRYYDFVGIELILGRKFKII